MLPFSSLAIRDMDSVARIKHAEQEHGSLTVGSSQELFLTFNSYIQFRISVDIQGYSYSRD
jgi:hypothetical protein